MVQQAYVEGVSTRKVDELLQALGLTGIDKSGCRRICKELDEVGAASSANRPLEGEYPYVWLDALYLKVRQNHRIVSHGGGDRHRGAGDRRAGGVGLCRGGQRGRGLLAGVPAQPGRRGLKGVQLVISDAHEGLKAALGRSDRGELAALPGALHAQPAGPCAPGDRSMVAAAMRTIFAQPDRQAAGIQLAEVVQAHAAPLAEGAELWRKPRTTSWPTWPSPRSTGPGSTPPTPGTAEQGDQARTDVVGIFPDGGSVEPPGGSRLAGDPDEWQVGRRYFSLESMAKVIDPQPLLVAEPMAFDLAPVH